MYENVGTRVPAEVVEDIEYVAQEEKTDKSKVVRELLAEAVKRKLVELALKKYSERKVSLGRAAKLARMPLADFMKVAAERRIAINYSVESLEEDFRNASKQG